MLSQCDCIKPHCEFFCRAFLIPWSLTQIDLVKRDKKISSMERISWPLGQDRITASARIMPSITWLPFWQFSPQAVLGLEEWLLSQKMILSTGNIFRQFTLLTHLWLYPSVSSFNAWPAIQEFWEFISSLLSLEGLKEWCWWVERWLNISNYENAASTTSMAAHIFLM